LGHEGWRLLDGQMLGIALYKSGHPLLSIPPNKKGASERALF